MIVAEFTESYARVSTELKSDDVAKHSNKRIFIVLYAIMRVIFPWKIKTILHYNTRIHTYDAYMYVRAQ